MKDRLFPVNLQLFAEGGAEEGASTEETTKETPMSFDDFLKGEGNQAEFDRRVQKALATAKEKWQAMTDDKVSEADKLAKMTKDEKAQYLQQKKDKELSDREAAIVKRELMAEAKNTLASKKLPQSLAGILNYADAETCNNSIASVEKAFLEAVQSAVEERLKGKDPMKKAPDGNNALQQQIETIMLKH